MVRYPDGDGVYLVVVISVFGNSHRLGAQAFIACPVGVKSIIQLLHCDNIFFKNQLFNNSKRIGHNRQPDAGQNRPDIVLCTAQA